VKEELSNKVHSLRTGLGITQEVLAKEVGVSRQTIVAVEKGNCEPSVLLALKIAKFFKLPLEEIFFIKK
jgi:putative transcriptional regulator